VSSELLVICDLIRRNMLLYVTHVLCGRIDFDELQVSDGLSSILNILYIREKFEPETE